MDDDYRNTKYCPKLSCLKEKKERVKQAVLRAHPKAEDLHKYISINNSCFKQQFIEAYNGKCPYCGVSLGIIQWKQFEIDHFIPIESSRFSTKKQAGYIENLVLACYDCNRSKSSLELSEEDWYKVNPDGPDICKTFVRDEDYYIRISEDFKEDESVNLFYSKLGLSRQIHRLDYLLMNMRGLRDSVKDKPSIYTKLNEAIELMMSKRR
jgi:5-methylcytosine-specific restriction endonuclease McrA